MKNEAGQNSIATITKHTSFPESTKRSIKQPQNQLTNIPTFSQKPKTPHTKPTKVESGKETIETK